MAAITKPIRGRRDRPVKVPKAGLVGRLDPFLYKETIQELGLTFRWSRAVVCPCRLNAETDQFDPVCARCSGSGWWYNNPDTRPERYADREYLEMKCAFSQAHINPNLYENFGPWGHGDAVLVVQNEVRIGFRDRFVGMDQEMAWSELLVRGEGADVPVGRSGRTTPVQKTVMRYEPVRVHLVATSDVTFREGVDYILSHEKLTEPRKLRWLAGHGPDPDGVYTVHYACRPVWVVEDITYGVQFAFGPPKGIKGAAIRQELPVAVKVKLDFTTDARGT